ncbi:MAG: rhodanese-like domain-containing protein [Burkholderiaceae bacterium]|nr:rhodanese-like domain-containing protein [Burkholderiaceae bacterium]
MIAVKRTLLAAFAAAASLLSGSALALDLPGPLIETSWLAAHQQSKGLVVLDVRNEKDKAAFRFVPGSRYWNWETVRVDRKVDGVEIEAIAPTRQQFESLMRGLGIGNSDAVVIVSPSNNASSFTMGTRAYWTMKYFGHDKVALLDGGVVKWTAEKRPTAAAPAPTPRPSGYKVKAVHDELLALTPEVLATAYKKTGAQLVDGRAPDFYLGEKKKDYVYAQGHIPGARLVANADLLDPKTGTLKSMAELRTLLASSGVDAAAPIITYCDSGHLSTGVWFVAHELLRNPSVKLYDGSMHEWTKDPTRPVSIAKE